MNMPKSSSCADVHQQSFISTETYQSTPSEIWFMGRGVAQAIRNGEVCLSLFIPVTLNAIGEAEGLDPIECKMLLQLIQKLAPMCIPLFADT